MDYSRKTIDSLIDILQTLNANTQSTNFRFFLKDHVKWLLLLQNDLQLYNPMYTWHLHNLMYFLEDPESYFEGIDDDDGFLETFQEYMHIKRAFMNHPNWAEYQTMKVLFQPIVSELRYIIWRTPPNHHKIIHEKNRHFYRELNAHILKPERVERISKQYGMDCTDYLDAIDA